MSIKILHLSDIHIGRCVYDNNLETLAFRISNEIVESYNLGSKFNTIVVSGDIFDGNEIADISSRSKRIDEALIFFNTLLSNLGTDGFNINKENVIFCPGNHDVIRAENEADFSVYTEFLKRFYEEELYNSKFELYECNKSPDSLISLNLYKDAKIGILSLNSACISKDIYIQTELEKIVGSIEFDTFESIKTNSGMDISKLKIEMQSYIKEKNKNKYLDYGFISDKQLSNMRGILNNVENIESYTIVAVFHHHLQPFPEVFLKDKSDVSIMKNAPEVINRLLKHKINIVLHGHKHMDLITPITNEQFIENHEDMVFAISAGSIGKNDITNRMFQIIEIFNKNESKTKVKITKYKYNQDKCEVSKKIEIPPKEKLSINSKGILKDTLEDLDINIYNDYMDKLYESDTTSTLIIEKSIEFIENTIFQFPDMCNRLKKDKYISLLILISIHYRINSYLDKDGGSIKRVKDFFEQYLKCFNFDKNYYIDVSNFIEANFINNENVYKKLVEDVNIKYKNYTGFVLATTLIIDIYMFLSTQSEMYFKYINHKVNITVNIDEFNMFIPQKNIVISSIPDRREINVELKSKHPSFHKVAVIILKNIEKNMNRYEQQLGYIGLKLYNIKTKIEKQGYEQDDYNFEAYLPTLMDLLIGKNLYKQKEVFVRELIQNSFDAIMLRKKIDKNSIINDSIEIEMRMESDIEKSNKQHEVRAKILTIRDEGIGMNLHNIERYFTGIGRSFYTSDDFEQLKKVKDARYSAISNFGIGFLSCFMVAEEIDVDTRYYEENSPMITVNIPNFDGCFFVKNQEGTGDIGTTITLYEKTTSVDKLMNFEGIYNYIKRSFIDFPLDINIKINNDEVVNIESFSKKRNIAKRIEEGNNIVLHVFMDEHGKFSYSKENNLFDQNYGIFVIFNNSYIPDGPGRVDSPYKVLNSGIALQNDRIGYELLMPGLCEEFIINYPPSIVQLDVSRESIVGYKYIDMDKKVTVKDNREYIKLILLEQVKNIFENCMLTKYSIVQYFYVLHFMSHNNCSANEIYSLIKLLPDIYVAFINNKLILSTQLVVDNENQDIKIKTIIDLIHRYIYNAGRLFKENEKDMSFMDFASKMERELEFIGGRTPEENNYNTFEDICNNRNNLATHHFFMRAFDTLLRDNVKYDYSSIDITDKVNNYISILNHGKNNSKFYFLMRALLAILSCYSYSDTKETITIDLFTDNHHIVKNLFETLYGENYK